MEKKHQSKTPTKLILKEYSPRELYELTLKLMEIRIEENRLGRILNNFADSLPPRGHK